MRLWIFFLSLVFLAGCRGDGPGLPIPGLEGPVEPATATALDSLAEAGARVSISGTVLEQDGTDLLVDDGTGIIRVELPEAPPLMTGHRLLASGRLDMEDGFPRLRAAEWLYDSTAVPVHSD